MKFAIVFILAFCAFATHATFLENNHDDLSLPIEYELELYGNFGLLDKLRELVQKIIDKAQEAIEKISEEITKIVKHLSQKIVDIVERAKDLIKNILKAISDKITAAAAQGEVAKRCADAAAAELSEIADKAQEELQTCATDAIDDIKDIRQEIDEQVKAVQENLEKLSDIIVTCLETNGNPISIIYCITNQTNEIREAIISILANTKNSLQTAGRRSVEITKETTHCVQSSVVKFQQQASATVKKLNDCIKDGQPKNLLLN